MIDMAKYMACICGWVSEPYPDDYMFMGLGGILDCPDCRANLRNATLEMCYGNVYVITSEELKDIREQEVYGIMWEQAFRNLQRKRLTLEMKKGLEALKTEECKPFVPVIECPNCGSIDIGKDDDENHLCNECSYHFDDDELWEEKEDNIRKSKRKSIRIQGKYKGRGKEKRREP